MPRGRGFRDCEQDHEQDLHARMCVRFCDGALAPRQTTVERVLVLAVTGSSSPATSWPTAFAKFEQTVARAAETRDWDPWVEQYTDDVVYVEHAAGTMTRPRTGAGLDLEDDGDLPGQLHDVVPVAVDGRRRADRTGASASSTTRCATPATAPSSARPTSRSSPTPATGRGAARRTSTTRCASSPRR